MKDRRVTKAVAACLDVMDDLVKSWNSGLGRVAEADIKGHVGQREIVERGAPREFRDETDTLDWPGKKAFPAVRVIGARLVILATRAELVNPAIVALTAIREE